MNVAYRCFMTPSIGRRTSGACTRSQGAMGRANVLMCNQSDANVHKSKEKLTRSGPRGSIADVRLCVYAAVLAERPPD